MSRSVIEDEGPLAASLSYVYMVSIIPLIPWQSCGGKTRGYKVCQTAFIRINAYADIYN